MSKNYVEFLKKVHLMNPPLKKKKYLFLTPPPSFRYSSPFQKHQIKTTFCSIAKRKEVFGTAVFRQ